MKQPLYILTSLLLLTACNGIDLGIYDDDTASASQDKPANVDSVVIEDTIHKGDSVIIEKKVEKVVTGEIYINASSWKDWYYVDLHAIHDQIAEGGTMTETFPAYPIPLTPTANWDGKSGIYYYWYDVKTGGKGVTNHHKSDSTFYKTYGVSDIHSDPQPEPASWDFAIHRDNVRTNGGAAYQTSVQDIATLASLDTYKSQSFTADTWNETDVWTDNTYMLLENIGNQGIMMNTELSKWLRLDIPPYPPSFTYNGNVFILRMKDGKYAALRLKDYINTKTGTKCCMTIEFKYPLK